MATVNLKIVIGEVVSFEYKISGMGSWTKCKSSTSISTSTAIEIRNVEAYPGRVAPYYAYYNTTESTYTKDHYSTFDSTFTIGDVSYNRYIQFGSTKPGSYSITIDKDSTLKNLGLVIYPTSSSTPYTHNIIEGEPPNPAYFDGFDSTGYIYIKVAQLNTTGQDPVTGYPSLTGDTWTIRNSSGAWSDQYINIKSGSYGPKSRSVTIKAATKGSTQVSISAGTGVSTVYGRLYWAKGADDWSSGTNITLTPTTSKPFVEYKFAVSSGYGAPYYLKYNTSSGETKTMILSGNPGDSRDIDDVSFNRILSISATKDSRVTYDLYFDSQGGTGGPTELHYGPTLETSHTFTIPGEPNVPTKSLSKFKGWSNSPNGKVIIGVKGGSYTVTTTTSYLYAIWENSYLVDIKVEPEGAGTVDGEHEIITDYFYNGTNWRISNKTLSFDKSATGQTWRFTPAVYQEGGYNFNSWDRSSTSGTITSRDSFVAKFDGKISTATINLDGGSAKKGKEKYCNSRRVKFGDIYSHDYTTGTVQTLELPDSSIVEKANFDFVRLKNSTTGVTIENNTPVTEITTHELKVEWERIVYNVSFDSQGGTLVSSITLDDSKDPQVTLSDIHTSTKENYNFIGWKSAKGTMYYVGSTIKYSEEQEAFDATGHTLILEAQWEPELAIKVTVNESGKIIRKQVPIKGGGVYVYAQCDKYGIPLGWHRVTDWWVYTVNGWKHMVDNE